MILRDYSGDAGPRKCVRDDLLTWAAGLARF